MSLYLEEKIDEQKKKEDPLKDKITFTDASIFEIPPSNEDSFISGSFLFVTQYKFHAATWILYLERNNFSVLNNLLVDDEGEPIRGWNGTCICSYNLYSDTEMKVLFYSSPKMQMLDSPICDRFDSPDGFMTKFEEALNERKVVTAAFFTQLQLPAKYFFRPHDMPYSQLSKKLCDEYPTNLEKDFRFDFLKDSDMTIKCPDGSIRAMRVLLNISSTYMKKRFDTVNDNELVVDHLIDVIKPVVIFLHTRYFQMPKTYDLDYVKRLYKAYDLFDPTPRRNLLFEDCLQQALCNKFIQEKHTFDSILQWTSLSCQNRFYELERIVSTVIAEKFYYEWNQTFPQNTRNTGNQMYRDIFGDRSTAWIFYEIEKLMIASFTTTVILP